MKKVLSGIELIAKERQEQIDKHKIRVIDDVAHNSKGELLQASTKLIGHLIGVPWPASLATELCQNMDRKTPKEKLICAGAFIAAEIDRLQALENG